MSEQTPRATPPMPAESGFQPIELLRIFRKNVWLIGACFAAVLTATIFWTLGQPRIYRASTLLRFDPDPPRPLGKQVEVVSSPSNLWNRKEFYETEFRVIRSTRVCLAVVRQLGLHADPGFVGVPPAARASFKPIAVDDAAAILAARLSVEPLKDSSLAYVHYEDTDIARAQSVLSTLNRVYLAQNLENAASVSTSAVEWLNGQLDTLKDALEKSESALADFRAEHNVLSVSLDDRANMTLTQLEAISKQRVELQIRRIELNARAATLASAATSDPEVLDASDILTNPLIGSMRASYIETKRKIEELETTLGDNHPRVTTLIASLDATRKSIAKEITNLKQSSLSDVKQVDRQLGDLKKAEEDIIKSAQDVQTLAAPFNQLVRKKANNEKLYSIVLERARETELTRVMNFNNIRVIEDPLRPKVPVRPNNRKNAMAGAAVGLLIGCALAFVREKADRSLKSRTDVEEALQSTFLGLIPAVDDRTRETKDIDLLVHQDSGSSTAEAMRLIRTNISFRSPDHPYRTIVVSSALPSEGKTTIAISLAISLAQAGHKVLLVDTDLRRPRVHRAFGMSNDVGASMHLTSQLPLDECIQSTEIPNLSVMPSGPIPPVPAELIQSDRFKTMLNELRNRYDRIVFDSSPIIPVTDAAILAQHVDGVLLVARGHKTPRAVVAQALRRFLDVNSPIIGVVLNAIDVRRIDYGGTYYYSGRYYGTRDNEGAART